MRKDKRSVCGIKSQILNISRAFCHSLPDIKVLRKQMNVGKEMKIGKQTALENGGLLQFYREK